MKTLISFLALCASAFAWTKSGTTYTTTGAQSDVQSAIIDATANDTVSIPSGTFTWASSAVISGKAIKLQGAGAGRVVGRSATSATVPSSFPATVNFTRITEVIASIESLKSAITVGATLKIYRLGGEQNGTLFGTGKIPWMRGTVTSYNSGTGALVMSITSSSYSDVAGTHPLWIITTEAQTTILHGGGSNSYSLEISEDATASVDVSGIRFGHAVGNTGDPIDNILVNYGTGKPVLVHDCYFERTGQGSGLRWNGRRGIIWNCSFVSLPYSFNGQCVHAVADSFTNSWSTAGTMGTADTDGTANLYIEDCDWHAYTTGTDADANTRMVVRNTLLNHADVASHGADTGPYGVRHVEIYGCHFAFNAYNDGQTLPVDRMINMRGGTWIVTGNTFDNFTSTDYGDKPEIKVEIQNLGRNSGPNPGWGYDISGIQYPCPRQVGMGRITGTAGNDPSGVYKGDSDPIYIWGNTGTVVVSPQDYGWGNPFLMPNSGQADFESKVDLIADYFVSGRDYFKDSGAKPGWTAYTYPHPLRSITPSAGPGTVTTTRMSVGTMRLQ